MNVFQLIALEAILKTRRQTIPVGSTAASMPQTVLITASRAIVREAGTNEPYFGVNIYNHRINF